MMLILVLLAASSFLHSASTSSTSSMKVYSGTVYDVICEAQSPSFHLNGKPVWEYDIATDLPRMGIELKNETTARVSLLNLLVILLPTVCVNGSVVNGTVSLRCLDITTITNITVSHTVVMTYETQLPSPESVNTSDSQIIEWNQPTFVLTEHVEINSIDISYKVYISGITTGTNSIHETSDTQYNVMLSGIDDICYGIEVSALHVGTPGSESIRSTPIYLPQGCLGILRVQHTTAPTEMLSTTMIAKKTSRHCLEFWVFIVVAVVCSLVFCACGCVGGVIISVCVYYHMKKSNNSLGQQRPPVYEEVWEPGSVGMKENVAYGPIKKTSM